jgi:hypothetical protein
MDDFQHSWRRSSSGVGRLSQIVLSRSDVEVVGRFRNPWLSGAVGVAGRHALPSAQEQVRPT